jgi:hypothetical protein
MSVIAFETISSRKRLAWRALRATSDSPFLWLVELLERPDRQVDVVLLEAVEARRIVHQHVRVEHEELGERFLAGLAGLLRHGGVGGRRRFGAGFDPVRFQLQVGWTVRGF